MPDMKERETQLGYRFIGGSPDKLAALLKAEIAKWGALAQKGAFKWNTCSASGVEHRPAVRDGSEMLRLGSPPPALPHFLTHAF